MSFPVGAHPRSRGENDHVAVPVSQLPGSSPLTRGKPLRVRPPRKHQGLIPAHAGKTRRSILTFCVKWAHPRPRGENGRAMLSRGHVGGSSPLTRGKLMDLDEYTVPWGLIPAHAGKTGRTSAPACWSPAHPRSRGENAAMMRSVLAIQGSSPLTRGKRTRTSATTRPSGLIPAHAGKTTKGPRSSASSWAHPRSRGENACGLASRIELRGSSPLTRGKHVRRRHERPHHGLIPAHAGKTCCMARLMFSAPAHPRSRGENYVLLHADKPLAGSSPLTRGKLRASSAMSAESGLIPAHAGKTPSTPARRFSTTAHPRSRGENHRVGDLRRVGQGSSPLTRGKQRQPDLVEIDRGLIPAHAGKTEFAAQLSDNVRAHPRSRGENHSRTCLCRVLSGSSPLTRGKHPVGGADRGGLRLIPAHAGKTTGRPSASSLPRAHPRSRGENAVLPTCSCSLLGSSPLTRGKRRPFSTRIARSGLIPAHAGKTPAFSGGMVGERAHPRSRGENFRLQ